MEMSKVFKQIKAYAEQRDLPVIPINARSISLLKDPSSFYRVLLDGLRSAKSRVALSALYIGTGSKELDLMRALQRNLSDNPRLNVSITMDKNRASRENQPGASAVTAIQESLINHPIRLNLVEANMENPSFLQKLFSKFQRLNELSSTYHAKAMLFDDNLILTGANLSGIYFDARQDRYIRINKSKLLADYLYGFFDAIKESGTSQLTKTIADYNNDFVCNNLSPEVTSDTYIIPIPQFGPQDLRSSDDFLIFLNSILSDETRVCLSTGYFNPKIQIRLNSVIAPSEKANGFYDGGTLLRYVPRVYTAIMENFLRQSPKSEISLYNRPGWSYHAKGVWIECLDELGIYMIGSSNYNWRSSERDFELQFLILTTNSHLRQNFRSERESLLADSISFAAEDNQLANPIFRLAAKLLKSLL